MNAPPEMRSPAAPASAHQADIVRNDRLDTTKPETSEAFAARFVARRFGLPFTVARLVCGLASIGGRCT